VAYVRSKTYLARGGPDDPHTLGRDGRWRVDQPWKYVDEPLWKVTYYQLVESRRVNGQPRQRLIAHLGPYRSVDDALLYLPRRIRSLKRDGGSAKAIAKLERKFVQLRSLRRQGIA
jgi:hypothetical protein